jgi:NAD(P)-dependent dehydrogenase (short-subunit alcohol dehydrogenase family)
MGAGWVDGFGGRVAVVTGAGTGMGRELVVLLTQQGCDVAACDVSLDTLTETAALCGEMGHSGEVLTQVADVADRAQMDAFAAAVGAWRPQVHLLFNNAGIGGGGSFVDGDPTEWERTFSICWGGVYNGTRAMMPLLLAADQGHVINTSSVNGFWASLGPLTPHTAYSAAKFAVKGFTEALLTDFRINAPHLSASVVMPGHIGTSIAINSSRLLGRDPKELNEQQLAKVRANLAKVGLDPSGMSDEDLKVAMSAQAESFRDDAPMSAAQAAQVILDGVARGDWRILVGEDAHLLDEMVRHDPVSAYEPGFMDAVRDRGAFGFTRG